MKLYFLSFTNLFLSHVMSPIFYATYVTYHFDLPIFDVIYVT